MSFKAFSDPSAGIPGDMQFRPISDTDLPFLQKLYASTRQQEMDLVDWTSAQRDQFLTMQFEAQHSFYIEQFTTAEFLVVERDAEPIGRVYVDRREAEIRLIDIALLPGHRGLGLGTKLLEELLIEAKISGLPVTIHVEKNNPAMKLYLRLGFTSIEEQGVYDLLEWRAERQSNSW